MYQQHISRMTPGCIVILLDRSDSMGRKWGDLPLTLAEGAAQAVNSLLLELGVRSVKSADRPMRHYFDVGVFGYGRQESTGNEGVESALGGELVNRGIVALPELARKPLEIHEEPSPDFGGAPSRLPVWIKPLWGNRTPMCEAISLAGGHLYDWTRRHPDSFPPIVLNITDGFVTDDPYQGASLVDWAARLTRIRTADGSVLLFNIFLTDERDRPEVWFPARPDGLPEPGPTLHAISSVVPQKMAEQARAHRIAVSAGGRGLVFNADLAALVKFLDIGTQVTDVTDF